MLSVVYQGASSFVLVLGSGRLLDTRRCSVIHLQRFPFLVFLVLSVISEEVAKAQFVQQTKLVGTGAGGTVNQGYSVSLSSDGNTAVVGGIGDNSGVGAAWIFTRSGGVWSQKGAKLVGSDYVGHASQGGSVSLSADGNTAIVGGTGDNGGVGAAWVYIRSGDVWSQQGVKLVGTGSVGNASQGFSVSLSADGNTAIVGGYRDNNETGAAWVFTRSGGAWSQQGTKLVGASAGGSVFQGYAVSLSADGNTAIVGGIGDSSGEGAAWVFVRTGDVWRQQGAKLVGSGVVGIANQGMSVSLSADGNTAIVGGELDDNEAGAAWVFTRNGDAWGQQGNKLVGTGAVNNALQGKSVALSADGNTAIVGGDWDNSGAGAAWVFTRSGDVWTQQGSKLVGSGAVGSALQGFSLSLSADGSTAIVGGAEDDGTEGATWIFTRSGDVWTQQGAKLLGNSAVGSARQGMSVSLSSDGNTAIMGGTEDNGGIGASWVFTRHGDAWSQQGMRLVGTGAVGNAYQGQSVSLSSDGNTAIVGGYYDDGGVGATWVFTRSGDVWSQLGEKLVGSGAVGTANQGFSVSLSADGNTAIVGGDRDNIDAGAAWIFIRINGVWSQQGAKLVGTGTVGSAYQGQSVSLSADGNTAIVSGIGDNNGVGAAWVFTRIGDVWSQQGAKLVGTGVTVSEYLNMSVSLSADGNTAIIGRYYDNSGVGAVWVFTRSGSVWSQQGTKRVGTGAVGNASQGGSVSLSGDGNTAIVGGRNDNGGAGAAWIFNRGGGVWGQLGTKLVGTDAEGDAWQGCSVALSSDGKTAIVGGSMDNNGGGAAWVYIDHTTAPPNPPSLLGPGSSSPVSINLATFEWQTPARSGGRYWFELATDSLFQLKVLDSALTDTVHPVSGLLGGNTYWWRVRGWNPLGWGGSSETWYLTAANVPSKVALASPPNLLFVPSDSVSLAWFRGFPYVDRYWYEIASDSLFASKIMDSLATDTSLVYASLTNETKWWRVRAHNVSGWGPFSDVWRFDMNPTDVHQDTHLPEEFDLSQNFPNPFNPKTKIQFTIVNRQLTTVNVFDLLGRRVATLVNEVKEPGTYTVGFDGSNLSSGVYFYRLQAGSFVQTRKLLLLR